MFAIVICLLLMCTLTCVPYVANNVSFSVLMWRLCEILLSYVEKLRP